MSSPRRSALASTVLLFALAAPVAGDTPAARSSDLPDRAEASFERFARTWLGEERRRVGGVAPRVRPGPREPVVTVREVGDVYQTELRATGRPATPWVGVVHYTELVYACEDLGAKDCTLASQTPQTAIFRYRGGRWTY